MLPRLAELGVPVWVSVAGSSASEYADLCAALDQEDDVATVELNVSCPNVAAPEDEVEAIVAAARAATSKPLYAKLSPALPDIGAVAAAAEKAGADGLSLVNTLRGLAIDERTLTPKLSTATGGLSGPALRPVALAAVFTARAATRLPIVGMGGIENGRHALEFFAAGAHACALGTVLFADPYAPRRVREELAAELAERGFATPRCGTRSRTYRRRRRAPRCCLTGQRCAPRTKCKRCRDCLKQAISADNLHLKP